jgi:biofilm PGA synthesis N-glycosyltransferase PgaC
MSTQKHAARQTRGYGRSYVLMTAAYNEEAFIEKTIASVLAQTVLPTRWVIVSDGSTDKTDEMVESYSKQHDFICHLKLTRPAGRSFGSKVIALNQGSKLLDRLAFDFIGNVDADVSLGPSYFESLLDQFERDPQLGIAAGFIHEEQSGEFRSRASNRVDSVPHAAQLVRRECYEAIGGYAVLKYGGEDWFAQTCARMNGWGARALPELKVFHHRRTGGAASLLRHQFRLGRLDYSFGSDPVFEIVKCTLRVTEKPWLLGAITRFLGFAWSGICGEARPVSHEFIAFLRNEQRAKIASGFRGMSRPRPTIRAKELLAGARTKPNTETTSRSQCGHGS